MIKVVSFSGGRTSGFMLKRLIDSNPNFRNEYLICFENTGKERDETLDFVRMVGLMWRVRIIWLEYCRVYASSITPGIFPTKRRNDNLQKLSDAGQYTHWFKQVDFRTASRKGTPFDEFLSSSTALPNPTGRGCSAQLKIRTGMRYLFSLGIKEYEAYIGIRADEHLRAVQIAATCEDFLHPKFPLIEDGITVNEVEKFWARQNFDLRLKSYEGNCDLCFLKSKWKRLRLMRDNPGMSKWWIDKERKFTELHPDKLGKSGFRIGETYEGLQQEADRPAFDFYDDIDIACSCAERGFEKEEI